MVPVIARPDDQVWKMIRHDFDKNWEKGYVIMKKIVVIGGGTMGLDIAQVFAKKGFDVVVRDINDDIIKASEARLNKGLDKLVAQETGIPVHVAERPLDCVVEGTGKSLEVELPKNRYRGRRK